MVLLDAEYFAVTTPTIIVETMQGNENVILQSHNFGHILNYSNHFEIGCMNPLKCRLIQNLSSADQICFFFIFGEH